jgi:hypothetical protein
LGDDAPARAVVAWVSAGITGVALVVGEAAMESSAPFHKLATHGDQRVTRRSLTRIVTMEPDRLQGLLRVNIVVRPSRLVLVFTS